MASKNNDPSQSTKAVRGKSKRKRKASETTGTHGQNFGEAGKLDASSRLIITPHEITGFSPYMETAKMIMDSIKSFYRDAWTTWEEIPIEDRDQMWKEFKTECAWDPQHDYQIFCSFENAAAYLLNGFMSIALKIDKPEWMLENVWARLNEKLEKSEEAFIQEMAAQANQRRLEKKREKKKRRTMTCDEVSEEKHVKNKKDDRRTLVEPHVERTNVEYKRSVDRMSQSQPTSEDDSSAQSLPDEEAPVLPEAIGGRKKGKAHGIGSQRCLGCQEEIASLRRQVQKLSKKQKTDRLRFARLENLVQNLIDICRSDESDDDSDGEN